MRQGFFFQAFVYLVAAVLSPIAKRLGLGSVLGYLVAGVVIGPFVLGFVGHGGDDVMHFAEFGVVMMLLVGLELQPSLLWRLRVPILGLGGLQVAVTTGRRIISFIFGLSWQMALVGMISHCLQRRSCSKLSKRRAKEGGVFLSAVSGHCRHPDVTLLPLLAVKGGSS